MQSPAPVPHPLTKHLPNDEKYYDLYETFHSNALSLVCFFVLLKHVVAFFALLIVQYKRSAAPRYFEEVQTAKRKYADQNKEWEYKDYTEDDMEADVQYWAAYEHRVKRAQQLSFEGDFPLMAILFLACRGSIDVGYTLESYLFLIVTSTLSFQYYLQKRPWPRLLCWTSQQTQIIYFAYLLQCRHARFNDNGQFIGMIRFPAYKRVTGQAIAVSALYSIWIQLVRWTNGVWIAENDEDVELRTFKAMLCQITSAIDSEREQIKAPERNLYIERLRRAHLNEVTALMFFALALLGSQGSPKNELHDAAIHYTTSRAFLFVMNVGAIYSNWLHIPLNIYSYLITVFKVIGITRLSYSVSTNDNLENNLLVLSLGVWLVGCTTLIKCILPRFETFTEIEVDKTKEVVDQDDQGDAAQAKRSKYAKKKTATIRKHFDIEEYQKDYLLNPKKFYSEYPDIAAIDLFVWKIKNVIILMSLTLLLTRVQRIEIAGKALYIFFGSVTAAGTYTLGLISLSNFKFAYMCCFMRVVSFMHQVFPLAPIVASYRRFQRSN